MYGSLSVSHSTPTCYYTRELRLIRPLFSAHGITAYTAGLGEIIADFNLNPSGSMTYLPVGPISLFSLYVFGIAFAPIWVPHAAERLGRSKIYLTCLPICALFHLGCGFSQTFASLAVCRFFAGFSGGPALVLLEGTFADVWDAETTNTYYTFQLLAQFFGTAAGPLIGGFMVQSTGNWRWTEWFSAILCGASVLLGLGMSETYQREIPRRRAKLTGQPLKQDPALSGVTIGEMVKITVVDPMLQMVTDPVTILSTIFLVFNFAVVLQFFFTVPVALGGAPPAGPGYSISQVGLAFTTAIAGSTLGGFIIIFVEHVFALRLMRQKSDWVSIEYRLLPAMLGVLLVTGSLFWIGESLLPSPSSLEHTDSLSQAVPSACQPSRLSYQFVERPSSSLASSSISARLFLTSSTPSRQQARYPLSLQPPVVVFSSLARCLWLSCTSSLLSLRSGRCSPLPSSASHSGLYRWCYSSGGQC